MDQAQARLLLDGSARMSLAGRSDLSNDSEPGENLSGHRSPGRRGDVLASVDGTTPAARCFSSGRVLGATGSRRTPANLGSPLHVCTVPEHRDTGTDVEG
jgi:hypothetical protein